ncbi:MAG: PAS domain S-box protein [Deltaproteobacteria bacterium]|nr:PAS domain S-box protein [Deltaproteobacteria bacterium]
MPEPEPIKVLYMEDNEGLARLVKKRLERAGYQVDIASDGKKGLEMFEKISYDAVAVDQKMPGYDGIEVIRILASQGELPPTVMITGTGDERLAVEAMKLGADDYMVKDIEGRYLELLPSVIEQASQRRLLLHQKRRAEEALLKSEALYRAIVEDQTELICRFDPALNLTFVNEASCRFFGKSRENLIGQSVLILTYPDDHEELKRNIESLSYDDQTIKAEYRAVTSTGEARWFARIDRAIFDDHGHFVEFQAVSRDIAERKQAEEEREQLIIQLQRALAEVKTLSGLLPICSSCKKIRDDKGYWNQLESFLAEHSDVVFTHGVCPECAQKLYPQFYKGKRTEQAKTE